MLAYFDRPDTCNGPTEAIIIWSPQKRVIDVAHGADRMRQQHVIWSMSSTRTTADLLVIAGLSFVGSSQMSVGS